MLSAAPLTSKPVRGENSNLYMYKWEKTTAFTQCNIIYYLAMYPAWLKFCMRVENGVFRNKFEYLICCVYLKLCTTLSTTMGNPKLIPNMVLSTTYIYACQLLHLEIETNFKWNLSMYSLFPYLH